ncbi:putative membrane-anchored protein [Sporomusaceae bacterium BoRhaA]|uniref:GDYXXLXY domain-containing protein n=1 Tax=Pelorhabdus rhamnosifermentans TaxID=2772457 RepID=UPI001C061F21|nr:GDYXXLXY domain-containing protein [Pelorhabdus rhamnosifermentans]MBU2702791.1 putative membrane-anchored protein [Pelorhabdus rhamnosifermentans]
MKKNKRTLWLFIVLAVIQLAVPLYMIWRFEDTLQTGQQYTWITAPVDPYDALRGRYVDLQFKDAKAPILNSDLLHSGQTAYAIIAKDEKGHAFISGVSAFRPEGNAYINVKINYIQDNTIANFTLPFKRYYMREELAPIAERAYRQNAGRDGIVTVRVKNGNAVVEELYIGDKTIYEYLRAERQK